MQELLLAINKPRSGPTGPGPQDIITGDSTYGYYGIASAADMPATSAILNQLGISTGFVIQNETCDYFKFAHQGLTKFIPLQPICVSLSWKRLYDAGAVYGTPTTFGRFKPTASANRLQNANISFSGNNFAVKLISGGVDPFIIGGQAAVDSEYYQLLYRMLAAYGNGAWGAYTSASLGGTNYMWVVQSQSGNTQTKLSVQNLARAINGYTSDPDDSRNILHWRPILQLES